MGREGEGGKWKAEIGKVESRNHREIKGWKERAGVARAVFGFWPEMFRRELEERFHPALIREGRSTEGRSWEAGACLRANFSFLVSPFQLFTPDRDIYHHNWDIAL